ncbi:hypothetical protein IHQ71_00405 [Rhizobium sp. TH2]|uniref:hypothetical protein n=1 Tax=Rhizobium sp. TH2 TaxID=2775403 RepID=UPI0021589DA4|nr:hypothetical protein [Rhizobium sp. TH2]UVC09135.1 hypothetical protein IHQ71_00405 [Rhizobium sp. TH2]
MNKTRRPTGYADRHLDCQFALEDRFLEIMDDAERSGWSPRDAAMAIVDLADNYVLKLLANDETDRQIREAMDRARAAKP